MLSVVFGVLLRTDVFFHKWKAVPLPPSAFNKHPFIPLFQIPTLWHNTCPTTLWSAEWWPWWFSSPCASSSSWADIWPGTKVWLPSTLPSPLTYSVVCKLLEHVHCCTFVSMWPMWDCVDRDILNQWGQRSRGRPWRRHGHHQCRREPRTCRGKERVLYLAPLSLSVQYCHGNVAGQQMKALERQSALAFCLLFTGVFLKPL